MENKKLTWKHYLGIAVVAVLVIYLVIGFSFSNKFFWGTKINGMNVAGKTADQVIEMFDKKADDYSLTIKERKDKTETLTVISSEQSLKVLMRLNRLRKIRDLLDGSRAYLVQNIMIM